MLSKHIIGCTVAVFISVVTYSGCEKTPEKRIEHAEQDLHDAKKEIREAIKDVQTAYKDEWHTFQFDMEAKLRDNEYRINELKRQMVKTHAKTKMQFDKEIETVEQRNENLKQRLAEYRDKGKEEWENFKKEFAGEVETIQKSLSDLAESGKK